jgi:hypothetical protein
VGAPGLTLVRENRLQFEVTLERRSLFEQGLGPFTSFRVTPQEQKQRQDRNKNKGKTGTKAKARQEQKQRQEQAQRGWIQDFARRCR